MHMAVARVKSSADRLRAVPVGATAGIGVDETFGD